MWGERSMSEDCVSYTETWRDHNPGWEYKMWSNSDIQELIDAEYGWFSDTYKSYEYDICRWDAARYVILHKHGGVYCDVDIECFRPVDDLFGSSPVVFDENPNDYNQSILTNSVYYAPVKCKFMLKCIKHLNLQNIIQRRKEDPNLFVLRATGPVFMTTMYYKWKNVTDIEHKSHIHFERYPRGTRVMADSSYVPESDEYGIHRSMGTWVM